MLPSDTGFYFLQQTIRGFIMNDQVIRLFHIINMLPRHQSVGLTIPSLKNKLLDKGYDVSIRTMQRDMNALESIFMGIESVRRDDRSICWFWAEDVPMHISKLTLKQPWTDRRQSSFNGPSSSNESLYYDAA